MGSRYLYNSDFPQPIKKIIASSSDIIHKLKMGERIDNIAQKYYNDPLKGWIIMCANPEFDNEFDIPIGTDIRIPYPLQRVWDSWRTVNEL
ncbi:MAG: hypothetical protein ABIP51_11335 [Bacteroidia bacterium]